MKETGNLGLKFDNSYTKLDKRLFSEVYPKQFNNLNLILYNNELGKKIGIDEEDNKKLEELLGGKKIFEGTKPVALAYAGHQFGYFNILGDGRANLLGEIIKNEDRYDIQLKGSGLTPYSRRGDGRGTLYSMLREYIISEAMYYLEIPTTRSLAVFSTGEEVSREKIEEGGILTRIAKSHIRVGTFEYIAYLNDIELLRNYTDYVINREFPELSLLENKYESFLEIVCKKQVELIVQWMRVGFIHGVMNTDNTSISCETIDYGPCAFINAYNPKKVFSSIDQYGRYSFSNQKNVIIWNLVKLAQSLLPIIDENEEKSIEIAQNIINKIKVYGEEKYELMLCNKIGLNYSEDNFRLASEFLELLEIHKLDYTNSFLYLEKYIYNENHNYNVELNIWLKKWKNIVEIEGINKTLEILKKTNPKVIPRNHLVEKALKEAVEGNLDYFEKLHKVLETPYDLSKDYEEFTEVPSDESTYKTYCGT